MDEFDLPSHYALTMVPWDAEFEDDHVYQSWSWWKRTTKGMRRMDEQPTDIACDLNVIKALASIFQVIFGAVTLYRTRGNEIGRYGYASFGLTVTPYAWMSVINLLGNLVRPNYPALYLVGSPLSDTILEEHGAHSASGPVGRLKGSSADHIQDQYPRQRSRHATAMDFSLDAMLQALTKNRKARKEGTVATNVTSFLWENLQPRFPQCLRRKRETKRETAPQRYSENESKALTSLLGISVRLVVLGVLSKFAKGNSTHAQRVWVMCWFAFGNFADVFSYYTNTIARPRKSGVLDPISSGDRWMLLFVLLYIAPAIGDFVVVTKMVYEYGICTKMVV
jgi:hypothetical protein